MSQWFEVLWPVMLSKPLHQRGAYKTTRLYRGKW